MVSIPYIGFLKNKREQKWNEDSLESKSVSTFWHLISLSKYAESRAPDQLISRNNQEMAGRETIWCVRKYIEQYFLCNTLDTNVDMPLTEMEVPQDPWNWGSHLVIKLQHGITLPNQITIRIAQYNIWLLYLIKKTYR